MGKFTSWLSRVAGTAFSGKERRSQSMAPPITITARDIDPETGVLRSDRFLTILAAEQARASGALLIIDMASRVDRLAQIAVADRAETLGMLAQAIRQAVRADDIIGHVEGDRFAVLLRGAEQSIAGMIAQRICDSVDDTLFIGPDQSLAKFDVAVGGATFQPSSGRDSFAAASVMLETARQSRTNRIAVN